MNGGIRWTKNSEIFEDFGGVFVSKLAGEQAWLASCSFPNMASTAPPSFKGMTWHHGAYRPIASSRSGCSRSLGTHGPEHMPKRMPDRMSEHTPERMPDNMLDRMPERM